MEDQTITSDQVALQSNSKEMDFARLISEQYQTLTKSEKMIANFLRKNQEESAFLSAGEIARRLDFS